MPPSPATLLCFFDLNILTSLLSLFPPTFHTLPHFTPRLQCFFCPTLNIYPGLRPQYPEDQIQYSPTSEEAKTSTPAALPSPHETTQHVFPPPAGTHPPFVCAAYSSHWPLCPGPHVQACFRSWGVMTLACADSEAVYLGRRLRVKLS